MKAASQTRLVIFALSCSLLLFTLIGLLATKSITYATPVDGTPTTTPTTTTPSPTDTTSPTPSPTATFTPSPTPSPTPTQVLTPTPTKTHPKPTPTKGTTPVPTQQTMPTTTPAAGQILPTATSGPQATSAASTPTRTTNGEGSAIQTPAISTPGTTSTPGSSSSSPDNSTAATGGWHTLLFVIPGILIGITALGALGFFLLRKFLSPVVPTQPNLPPSGARPWTRERTASMNGNTDLYGWENSSATYRQWMEGNLPFSAAMASATPVMGVADSADGSLERATGPTIPYVPDTPALSAASQPSSTAPEATGQLRSIRVSRLQSMQEAGQEQEGIF